MKKGFTLVELLAVITLLSILVVIAVPSLTRFLDTARKDSYNNTINGIVDASKIYVMDNALEYIDKTSFTISLDYLCENNYLSCPIVDPRDKNIIIDGYINVNRINEELEYTFIKIGN